LAARKRTRGDARVTDLIEPILAIDAHHEGWTALPERSQIGLGHSFVSGDPLGPRLRVAYFLRDADQAMVGRAWFGPLAEGPPRHAHGGALAALLDEVMGAAAWLAGHRVVAAKIEVDFKRPVPLGTTATFEGIVTKAEGRRVHMAATLALPDGTVASTASGLYIIIDIDKLRASAAR
jgi:acyl-coenzyme A thioesterase PaaI-like protein